MSLKRKTKKTYSLGDLVLVRDPKNNTPASLCIIVSKNIPSIYKINEFFMVYSVTDRCQFITNYKLMESVS